MTLANAHALFNGLKAEPSFLANLTIADKERSGLMEARQEIRRTIRAAAGSIPTQDMYWQDAYVRKVNWRNRPNIQIKFMTQGSFAYGTINAPAHIPAQEIDLDDGMYVPVSFLESGEPALAAKGLFTFVETALEPLCKARGWRLDKAKEHCVRVKLWPGAHVDIPIYSIPEAKFEQIRESLQKSVTASFSHDSVTQLAKLPSDQIMLAQRNGTWMKSDPQQLHDWVNGRVERYGSVYKRLCRFFKGWRDFAWEKSSLSSICLMAAIDNALRDMNGFPSDNRDDELIMEITKKLPEILKGRIGNPVLSDLCLNAWTDEDKLEIVRGAKALRDGMISALEQTGDATQVVNKLRDRFGGRIPYRPDSVKIASKIEAVIRSAPAVVAAPRVISSTSG
jgi:hypothetical protein